MELINLNGMGPEEKKRIAAKVIERFRKGDVNIQGACKAVGMKHATFYDYIRRYDDLRKALHEAKEFTAADYDDTVQHLARKRMKSRLAGEDVVRSTKNTITISGYLDATKMSETFDAEGKDTFDKLFALAQRLKDPQIAITETKSEKTVQASDALIVSASIAFDGKSHKSE